MGAEAVGGQLSPGGREGCDGKDGGLDVLQCVRKETPTAGCLVLKRSQLKLDLLQLFFQLLLRERLLHLLVHRHGEHGALKVSGTLELQSRESGRMREEEVEM